MPDKISINDLPESLQKQIKKENGFSTKTYPFSKDNVRTYSLAIMNVIKGLTPSQRKRVLIHSMKVNEV